MTHPEYMPERRMMPVSLLALHAASAAHIATHGPTAERFCPACIAYLSALGTHPDLPRSSGESP